MNRPQTESARANIAQYVESSEKKVYTEKDLSKALNETRVVQGLKKFQDFRGESALIRERDRQQHALSLSRFQNFRQVGDSFLICPDFLFELSSLFNILR
jgi:hypothetical protein